MVQLANPEILGFLAFQSVEHPPILGFLVIGPLESVPENHEEPLDPSILDWQAYRGIN